MSHDGENDTDVLAGTGASAALAISDARSRARLATVRVGRIHTDDGPQFILNPTVSQLEYSDLDLVLAGHKDGINMIEVGAAEVDEDVLDAIEFGYEAGIKPILALIERARQEGRQGEGDGRPPEPPPTRSPPRSRSLREGD
jgi:polyribonucleotide nucleotidyltransferase